MGYIAEVLIRQTGEAAGIELGTPGYTVVIHPPEVDIINPLTILKLVETKSESDSKLRMAGYPIPAIRSAVAQW